VITPRARSVSFNPSTDELTVTARSRSGLRPDTPGDVGRLRTACSVSLRSRSAHEKFIIRSSSNAHLAEDSNVVPAPQITFGGNGNATTLNLIPPWTYDTYTWFGEGSEPSPLETPMLVKEATDLGAFLAVAAPDYLGWIQQVTSDLVPVRAEGERMESRTNPHLPGRITATFPLTPLALGELLVHEASHLQLSLASEIAQLDDGTDAELYYSPAKKTMAGRPIDKILLAFHAWANICAYYESCLEKNLDTDGWAERSLKAMKKETDELRDGLEKSPALTNHGRALWTPFFE
jgi:HEXXH motif-containing protein